MKKGVLKLIVLALVSALFATAGYAAGKDAKDKKEDKKEVGEGIQVKLGKDISRDFKDVKADNYAYGPKQEYFDKTHITHIYLPYGNNTKLYGELRGRFSDPEPGKVGTFHSTDGGTNAILTYKITFDKPIGEFTLSSGRFEYGLVKDTCAGIEYSIDGNSWRTIKEVKGTTEEVQEGTIDKMASDFKADKLKTKTLYIRYYSRSSKEPKEIWGNGRWIKLWLAGDPSWGDAATTFFIHQPQIWVVPAK